MNIDKFIEVNVHLGHSTGDELLKQFGEGVYSVLREGDFLARQGGDEFVILLRVIEVEENAWTCAFRIFGSLQHEWKIGENLNNRFRTTETF